MKRFGDLWGQVCAFDNLLEAARKARLGKRFRPEVLAFHSNLETELLAIQSELRAGCYVPGRYRQFWIEEPKLRLISAAPYRDRVVHHALVNVIGPVFERSFISDSYANRVGFGTHRALRRFTDFSRSSRYALQCDVRKYFPSIDHAVLKALIRRRIKCPDTLRLLDTILDSSPPQDHPTEAGRREDRTGSTGDGPEGASASGTSQAAMAWFPGDDLFSIAERRRGLPIGNLTSQLMANVYLDGFDHFVKERLKARNYVRFVDDFALFSDDRGFLVEALAAIREHLAGLRLMLHTTKTALVETRLGCSFVGFHVLPDRVRVRAGSLRRGKRRMKVYQALFRKGRLDFHTLVQRVRAWVAHLEHADSWRLREQVFADLVFTRP